MATLSALKFPTADGAQKMEGTLLSLQKQHLIEVQDATRACQVIEPDGLHLLTPDELLHFVEFWVAKAGNSNLK